MKTATTRLSARNTPTAHIVIGEVHQLEYTINQIEPLETEFLVNAADKMAIKFAKYYGGDNLPATFIIAHILDPRAKTKFIEYSKDTDGAALKSQFTNTIRTTFNKYFKPTTVPPTRNPNPAMSTLGMDNFPVQQTYAFQLAKFSQVHNTMRNSAQNANDQASPPDDLEKYLSDDLEPFTESTEEFDILQWWRSNESKYPNLAIMAALFLGDEYFIHKQKCTFA